MPLLSGDSCNWRNNVFRLTVHSCEHDISGMPARNFYTNTDLNVLVKDQVDSGHYSRPS